MSHGFSAMQSARLAVALRQADLADWLPHVHPSMGARDARVVAHRSTDAPSVFVSDVYAGAVDDELWSDGLWQVNGAKEALAPFSCQVYRPPFSYDQEGNPRDECGFYYVNAADHIAAAVAVVTTLANHGWQPGE